jgi:hypothetical protein
MNNKKAKELRKLINFDDEISKRVYKRLKKQYKLLSRSARPIFIKELKKTLNADSLE